MASNLLIIVAVKTASNKTTDLYLISHSALTEENYSGLLSFPTLSIVRYNKEHNVLEMGC